MRPASSASPTPITVARRRRGAALAAVVALGLAVAACAGDDSSSSREDDAAPATTTSAQPVEGSGPEEGIERVALQRYLTRRDVTPPAIEVLSTTTPAPGLVFLAPKRAGAQAGPLIVDDRGETVWAAPETGADVAADLRVQTYEGEPVLTWWEGQSAEGRGAGELVIVDRRYREVARLRMGDGLDADFHEFRLTDEGTALLLAYTPEPADLSTVGGPRRGYEFENYVQEVDVATGEVLLEWRAGDHVPVSDTFSELSEREDGSEDRPLDWFHANSVAPGPDGRCWCPPATRTPSTRSTGQPGSCAGAWEASTATSPWAPEPRSCGSTTPSGAAATGSASSTTTRPRPEAGRRGRSSSTSMPGRGQPRSSPRPATPTG
jgi:hypothetical protein